MLVYVNKKELNKIRKQAGFSMYELSKKAGLGKNAVAKMISENRKSSLLRIEAIAHVLNVDVNKLVQNDCSEEKN